jgi:RNA polymerase sigma-70 factor (ECF subfamily)
MADQGAIAFEEFYLGTRLRLLRQLSLMTGDRQQAEDALQEAYVRAWLRWGKVSRLESPEGWVRTVAWRVAISQHRHSVTGSDLVRRYLRRAEAVADPATNSDSALDLSAALARLRPEHRRTLVLFEVCGLSVAQVAAETGVAEGTVKSRLARARTTLGQLLGAVYQPLGGSSPGDREPGMEARLS